MNITKWFEELRTQKEKKAIPVLSFPAIQLMEITVNDLVRDSDLQAEGMKAIADRVDAGAAVSMMDLSVEAEAFGSKVRYADDDVPTVIGHIVETQEDAKALEVPAVGTGRTGIYVDAIAKVMELITDRPVFAGVIGPFSLTGRLLDVTEAMIYCYEDPDMVHMVLDKATTFIIDYIKAYKDVGSHGVLIAEPLAGILTPDLNAEFSIPYVKRIIDEVQDENFKILYHNCGNAVPKMLDDIIGLEAAAFHFGNAINLKDILEVVPSDKIVMGNIDPASQFRNGSPDSVYEATKQLLESCGGYLNFVPSSGCDIPTMSSWDNIDAFFKATNDYYNR